METHRHEREAAMDLSDQLRSIIIDELKRQADISEERLRVEEGESTVFVHGPIDIEDLVMVIAGGLAGGP